MIQIKLLLDLYLYLAKFFNISTKPVCNVAAYITI